MSITVKLRRGSTTQHSTFTGEEAEVTVDTTKDVVVVHDGVTVGGHPMVKASSLATVATSGDYNDLSNKPTAGLGSVTSVGLSLPSIFSVSGSPVTVSGTLTGTLTNQTANQVFASPNGTTGTPTFRSLVAADIPTLNQNTTGTASNITATSNATLTTLSSLSLPYSQLSGTVPTWNQNTTGTAANVTGTVAIANGGTGSTTAAGALTALGAYPATNPNGYTSNTGTVTSVSLSLPSIFTVSGSPVTASGTLTGSLATQTANTIFAAPNGTSGAPTFRSLVAADIPTLNQNTTGTAANVTGTVSIANGGTGQTTRQNAMDALAGAVTSGQYLRGNGTDVVMSAIQAADVPTLNQNTTGTAANVTGTVAIANGGTGQTTANAAFNALAPSQIGQSGKYLTTDGTNTSWATVTGGGGGSAIPVSDEGTQITAGVTSLNFTGAGVTATASGNDVTVAITSGGISSADIQEFTATGTSTWTKPAGAKMVHVLLYGGGGGGGSGRRRATGSTATAAAGGSGGGAGGRLEYWIPASLLGSTVTVTVGAGSTGGAATTTDDTNGTSVTSGGNSSFGSFAFVRGGTGGFGGSTATTSVPTSGNAQGELVGGGTNLTANGGAGALGVAGSAGNTGGFRAGGGAGASGFATGSTSGSGGGAGGAGGIFLTSNLLSTGGGGTAGTAGSAGGSGGNGNNSTNYYVGGDGGGGGACGTTSAGSGGNGGYPGGGGGGGGAGHGVNSGAGGNGGNGYVRVTTFF